MIQVGGRHIMPEIKISIIGGQRRLCFFVAGMLLLPLYLHFMNSISQIIGFSTRITTGAYYLVLWVQLLTSVLPFRVEYFKRFTLSYGFLLALALISILLHPATKQYVIGTDVNSMLFFQPKTFLASGLFVFVGLLIYDFKTLCLVLHKSARIGAIMGIFIYVLSVLNGTLVHYDDMNYAYTMCAMICILVAMYEKNDLWFIIIGFVCLLIAGTRGPIACCLFAIILKSLTAKQSTKRNVFRITVLSLLLALYYSNLFYILIVQVSNVLAKFGINKLRLLDYLNSGMLLDSSGRDGFADIVTSAIWEQPIIGYGIGGDRLLLNGRYCHNFLLEVFVSFGFVLGVIIISLIGILGTKMIFNKDEYIKSDGIAMICSYVFKLMFSSSLVYSKELFLLIGLAINAAFMVNTEQEGKTTNGYVRY